MHVKGMLSLGAAVVVAVALVSVSGAGTAASRSAKGIDVSTRAAAVHYLRSIHVNPRSVVIQRGARNYAGPNCPGKGWTCTSTAHPVVQVAQAGGKNVFRCAAGRCAVVQAAEAPLVTNTAKCIRTTGITQSCSINQTSTGTTNNDAVVVEIARKLTGLTQNASQTAHIDQTADGGANTACVLQTTELEGSTNVRARRGMPVNVNLEAHQSVTITQDSHAGGNTVTRASPSGTCDSGNPPNPPNPLTQTQTIRSTAVGSGAIVQNENAVDAGANMSLDIAQNQSDGFFESATGANYAAFNQTNTLTAIASTTGSSPPPPAVLVSQTQSSVNGGILATVNQDSTNVNTANATQIETQCEDAHGAGSVTCDTGNADPPGYSLRQTQFGPVVPPKRIKKGDGDSAQTGGNPGSTFTINQTSTQDNDTGNNQTNVIQGDCSTSGTCSVTQTATVNGQQTGPFTQTGQDVSTSLNCTGSFCTTTPITFDGSPGTAAPPSTLGPYTMTAFGPDPQPACPNDGSIVTGVTDPAGTIGFNEALTHDTVGGCWATWSHGYTGDVYDTASAADPNQVTINLPSGTNAFYLYAEPNVRQPFTMTATAQDGTTSGPVSVDGEGGARYFGFYGTGGTTLASITVTADPDAFGLAVGEFGINTG